MFFAYVVASSGVANPELCIPSLSRMTILFLSGIDETISIPKTKEYTCNDWKVLWGERHRLADDKVRTKTIFVAQRLTGKTESEVISNMPSTVADVSTLTSGLGWCESRTLNTSSSFIGLSKSDVSEHPYDYLDDIGRKH